MRRALFTSALICLALLAALQALAVEAVFLTSEAGQPIYVRAYPNTTQAIAVALTAGTSPAARRYAVSDTTVNTALAAESPAISTAGKQTIPFDVFQGTPSKTADDIPIASGQMLRVGGVTVDAASATWLEARSGATATGSFGQLGNYLFAAFQSSGVYSTGALVNGPSGEGGGGGSPIAATDVSDVRTWLAGVDGSKASNIVTVKVGFAGTLAAAPPLNEHADIKVVSAIEITDPNDDAVTASVLTKTADGRKAHFDVPTLTVPGNYVVIVTVTTLDGQTIPMQCKLVVRP